MASRAVNAFWPDAAAACAASALELPLSTHTAGSASSTSTPSHCMALAQPTAAVRLMAMGAITNCPNDPPAFTMPLASPRLLAGTSRAVAAISTDGPAMPAPPAASTPIAKISPAVVVMYGVMKVPSATSATPSRITRPVPMRSATAPANGCVSPHHSWPNAKARLMLPMPNAVEVLSADRNRPMVRRVPMVSAKAPAAASSTSHSASGAADLAATGGVSLFVMPSLLHWQCCQQIERVVHQRMQGHHALHAQRFIQRELRSLPVALRLGTFFATCVGDVGQAAASIGARLQRDPSCIHQRAQVTRQRGRIHLHGHRQVARADRPQREHMRQQRILRGLEPALRHFGVVVRGYAAHQLAQLEVGAAPRQHGGQGGWFGLHGFNCICNNCICNSCM